MSKTDEMEAGKYVFGALLVVANRMETLLERELKEFDITTKQWFLSLIVDNLFSEPPTIKEVAKQMGSSHQNVKQVALKLQQKGLLGLEKDKTDARVTRLRLTQEKTDYWLKMEPKGTAFTAALFEGIEEKDMQAAGIVLTTMLANLEKLEKESDRKGRVCK